MIIYFIHKKIDEHPKKHLKIDSDGWKARSHEIMLVVSDFVSISVIMAFVGSIKIV